MLCYFRATRCFSSPVFKFPEFTNEPLLTFAPESKERESVVEVRYVKLFPSHNFFKVSQLAFISIFLLLNKAINQLKASKYDIPCVIGGKEYRTKEKKERLCVSLLFASSSFHVLIVQYNCM